MAQIKSDVGEAISAVSKFQLMSVDKGDTYSLKESNIAGMQRATKVSNKLVGELNQLEMVVKKQADKFPKLAKAIEQRDKQDALDISKMSWGFE